MATSRIAPDKHNRRFFFQVERATLRDAAGIQTILLSNSKDTSLFQRPLSDIQRNIPDYLLATDEKQRMLGCVAVHFHAPKVAEILSLSVTPLAQGKGMGVRLMESAEQVVVASSADVVYLVTTKPEYFARLGYRRASSWQVPKPMLKAKLLELFQQSPGRWLPGLVWRFSFMEKRVRECR
jgi:amino-acid N-acetyltransferase